MSANFRIELKKSNGNLHVRPAGDFDGNSAWELLNLLYRKYSGTGRIFIDTRGLGEVMPFGCRTFQCRLDRHRLPADRLFFKGEKGFEIAPQGCRVIVAAKRHQCRCNGDCENCRCKKHRKIK